MNHTATFLIVASAATLFACGKTEEAPVPATQPPAAEAPQAMPAPEPVAPVVEAPPAVAAPATQPEPPLGQPAAAPAASTPSAAAVASAPSTPLPDLARGQQVYRQACAFCHDKGVAGAPKTGDTAAWSPRLAQGMDALYTVAVRGKGAMPAKGGNPSLTDADVKAAVDHIIAQSR